MVDITWDIIKAGVTIVAGTYALGLLFLAFIGLSAIAFAAIILGVIKLAEGIKHVAKRISKKVLNKGDMNGYCICEGEG